MTNDELGRGAAVERAVGQLAASWRRVFRLTTIDQALGVLGVAPEWEMRRTVADRLAAEPGLSPVLRRWGVATFALSNVERLLGRELARADGALAIDLLAERLGLMVPAVRERLRMLEYLGIVTLGDERVALVPDHAARLGPLGWHFHAVQLDDDTPFNVPCPVDFLLLAHGAYPNRRLILRDICAQSGAPIRVEARDGTIVAVEPPAALVFRGGG
jgi:hypothetical protein